MEVHATDSSTSNEMISLGRISAAYGIKGWVKVYSYTDPIDNITSYHPWYFKRNGGWEEIEVLESRQQGKGMVAQLANCETRNDAEDLIGTEIAVPASLLAELDDGEYYWNQLQGLAVLNTENQRFGVVHHLLETGANDVIVVQADEASIDAQERLIPYLVGKVIKSIDLGRSEIIIDWDASW
jgi:16S rRNA processing protein RimM